MAGMPLPVRQPRSFGQTTRPARWWALQLCGSSSAEINGTPRLLCMTRVSDPPPGESVVVEPMQAFPPVKDLVTDVSWNYEMKKIARCRPPRPPDAADGTGRMTQDDADRGG